MERDKATGPFYHTGQRRVCNGKGPVLLRGTSAERRARPGTVLPNVLGRRRRDAPAEPMAARKLSHVTCLDLLAFSRVTWG